MSGRLDAFFSLTLCHAVVACVLFAGALSFYAPLATSYHHLMSLTALLYWTLVLFLLTILTAVVQLVMRMVRVGSGKLLQRYRRVGVMLANPPPAGQNPGHRQTSQNLTFNNSGNVSWTERLRRLTDPTRQNNNNNNNNNIHNDDGVSVSTSALLASGFGQESMQRSLGHMRGLELSLLSSASAACSDNVDDTDLDKTLQRRMSELCRRSGQRDGTTGDVRVDAQLNANNSNNDQRDNAVHTHGRKNASSSAGRDAENFSSNHGAEDVPRVSRRTSAVRQSNDHSAALPARSSAQTSAGLPPRSSTGQSFSQEARRQSSADRRHQSVTEPRRSSAEREWTVNPRSSTAQSVGQVSRRSSARQSGRDTEPRRSSAPRWAAAEPRRPSTAQSVSQDSRRSWTLQSSMVDKSGRRRSSAGDDTLRTESARSIQEPYRSNTRAVEASEEAARRSPEPLIDCSGARDGRLLSLPGFPRIKPKSNTPYKPVPPRCLVQLDCPPKERFSSRRNENETSRDDTAADADGAAATDDCDNNENDNAKTGVGPIRRVLNKLGLLRSDNKTSHLSVGSRASYASWSGSSVYNRRNCATCNESRNNQGSRCPSRNLVRLSEYNRVSFARPVARPSDYNTSANSSAAFDVYWSKFWDQITPHQGGTTHQLPLMFDSVSLSELKAFTGRLVESVVAKLKAQCARPSTSLETSNNAARRAGPVQKSDIEALCRDLLRELVRDYDHGSATPSRRNSSTCGNEPTILVPGDACDESIAASLRQDDDATLKEDKRREEGGEDAVSSTDLLLDDACLREFATGVVEGLYSAMRRKLQQAESRNGGADNRLSCSSVIAEADTEIRSRVRRSLYSFVCVHILRMN